MNEIFTALIEHKEFKKSRPWTVVRQRYDSAVISTPHYAETIEILVCNDIVGSAYIDGEKYDMGGKKVFYIAPMTVHSFEYKRSEGTVAVIKIHIDMLRDFLDLPALFEQYGASVGTPSVMQDNFDEFSLCADKMEKGDTVESLIGILTIARLLALGEKKKSASPLVASHSESINEIIRWTEENHTRKISLDEVSGRFGYTKNYFCDMFKSKTGITYLKYLNTLRISNACDMIKTGIPINRVSHLCGFETDSYFIQLFKKTIGVTPKQYQMGKMR